MKRILAATISILMAAGMLSACSSDNDNNPDVTTEVTTTVGTTEETNEESDTLVSDGENQNLNDAQKISQAINDTGEWTSMMEVEDEARLEEYFKLDAKNANYQEISVKQAMISAAFAEIIVIKAADGKVEDVVKDLEARKKKLVDEDAFYPEHKELAEKAIIGSEGDFAYLIAGTDNETCETAAKDAIKALKA